MPNYYKILGVSRKASCNEIRRAYQKLAIKWHPDKNPKNLQVASRKFTAISEAYEVLSDKTRRRQYNRTLGKKKHKEGSANNFTFFELRDLAHLLRKFVEALFLPLKKVFVNRSTRRFAAAFQAHGSCGTTSESVGGFHGVHMTCSVCHNKMGVASTSAPTPLSALDSPKRKKSRKTNRTLDSKDSSSEDDNDEIIQVDEKHYLDVYQQTEP